MLRRCVGVAESLPCRSRKGRKGQWGFKFVPKDPAERPVELVKFDPESGWSESSKRTGLITRKLGMLLDWNKWGTSMPCTILQVESNQVLDVKTRTETLALRHREGKPVVRTLHSMQVAAFDTLAKRLNKPLLGQFDKVGVPPKRVIREFSVTQDALLEPGTRLYARHFVPGQYVDVVGTTKGKGFQGAMKRHGFHGGPASHGASLFHRGMGSTGQRQDPGRVFPGKKMPGHMGNEQRTVRNLFLWRIFPRDDVLVVKGAIPGATGGTVIVKDAFFKKFSSPPPFPTYFPVEGEEEPQMLEAEMGPQGYHMKPGTPAPDYPATEAIEEQFTTRRTSIMKMFDKQAEKMTTSSEDWQTKKIKERKSLKREKKKKKKMRRRE